MAYGIFVMLLAIIPNSGLGRLAFLGCGGIVCGVGLLLLRASKKIEAATTA